MSGTGGGWSLANRIVATATLLALTAPAGFGQLGGPPPTPPAAIRTSQHPNLPPADPAAQSIEVLPFTITQPGRYVLTSCLTGVSGQPGLVIDADNVLVELNGLSLIGVPGSQQGIIVVGRERVGIVLRNGNVHGWPLGGVDSSAARQVTAEQLTLADNGLESSLAPGMLLGPESTVIACIAESNGSDGIVIGINGRVSRSICRLNGGNGLSASSGTTVAECTSSDNAGNGIAGSGLMVLECVVRSNSAEGIDAGSGSVVADCVMTENTGNGIRSIDSCTLVRNFALENSLGQLDGGIRTVGSKNYVADNTLIGNQRGLWVGAGGNVVVRNFTSGNVVFDFSIFPGNQSGAISAFPGPGFTAPTSWGNLRF